MASKRFSPSVYYALMIVVHDVLAFHVYLFIRVSSLLRWSSFLMRLFRVLSLYILVIVSLSLFYSHALFRNVPERKEVYLC